ncbi:MAG: peptidylprolyl isomerase [Clostridium sp.]|uniref:peptidylprolyl isomerase n=1 Tax=Clostridium sp. TaxID=1506 RepID=UPI003D6D56D3
MKRIKFLRKTMVLFTLIFVVIAGGCGNKEQAKVDDTTKVEQAVEPTAVKKPTEKGANDKNPMVTIEMEDGSIIKIELYPEIAPNTVRNFVSLVQSKFYDGLIFHRVITDFMIQGGDPEGTGTGGPGYEISGEFSNNGFENALKHERGVISMARSADLDSAGSQFFIMVKDTSSLDGDYAPFGKVTQGLETVDKIVAVEKDGSDKPTKDQKMKKVTVDTFGVKYGEVEKMK